MNFEKIDSQLVSKESFEFTKIYGVNTTISSLFGLRKVEEYCKNLPFKNGISACVDKVALNHNLSIENIKAAALVIPASGPVLISANHPSGILDGVILLCGLLSRRSDVMIISNEILKLVPLLNDLIIPVKKVSANSDNHFSTLMQVRRALKRNQCVIVFPAGTVAHWHWSNFSICDAPWTSSVQNLAKSLNVTEYTAHLSVINPLWFHLCAAFFRQARTVFLLRVFLSKSVKVDSHPVAFKLPT